VGAGFSDRAFLPRRNLTDAADGFLLGLLLGLGMTGKERISEPPALCGNAPPIMAGQVTMYVWGPVLELPTMDTEVDLTRLSDCRMPDAT
jgi:hypothetical protein